jgi:hypothetical protein
MANCNETIRTAGIKFAVNAKLSSNEIMLEAELKKLGRTLSANSHDAIILMSVIEGAFKLGANILRVRGLSKADTSESVEKFVASKGISEELTAGNLSYLRNIKGFESFDAGVETLKTLATAITVTSFDFNVDETPIEKIQISDYEEINFTLDEKEAFLLDDFGVEMARKKNALLKKTSQLKKDTPEYWGAFLAVYFKGMTSYGRDFTEWSRTKFYDKLIDFTKTNKGVETDINQKITELKEELQNELLDLLIHDKGDNKNKTLQTLFGIDSKVKERYFTEVLLNEFDFVLNSLIKSIVVSEKDTAIKNKAVNGFVDIEGNALEPISLHTNKIDKLLKKRGGVVSIHEGVQDKEMREMEDMNTVSFYFDTDLPNDAFYKLGRDNKFFYRNIKGVNFDITPLSYYSYDNRNKRNVSSIDHFIDSMDSSTNFINNIFPIFKLVSVNSKGKEFLGRRMTATDFLTIAPFLTNAGADLNLFISYLKNMASDTSTIQGRIAKSLLIQVFNKDDYANVGGESIYSLYTAAHRVSNIRGGFNEDIIKALHSALINKDHIQYLEVKEGRTTITKGIENVNNSTILDDGLVNHLMNKNFTKPFIAKKLVIKGVYIGINSGGVETDLDDVKSLYFDGLNPSMEKIANTLGLGNLLVRLDEHFKETYNIEQAEKKALDIFIKIIKVAAANVKAKGTSRYYIPRKLLEKSFPHKNYNVLTPSSLIHTNEANSIAKIFIADTTHNITIAGKKNSSTTHPNRDAFIGPQIKEFNHYNLYVNRVMFTFNPFIQHTDESSLIPKASLNGVVIKAPLTVDGEHIGLSELDLKNRIQHSIISGILEGPKNIGKEFYLQPTNYSDKSTPSLHRVEMEDENLLAAGDFALEKLKDAYVEYHRLKAIQLQKVTINSLSDFILSNYNKVVSEIESGENVEYRKTKLKELKALLTNTELLYSKPNMTRTVNVILAEVALRPDFFKFSNAEMDFEADYISLSGAKNVTVLKPNLGVRAEKFSNLGTAYEMVDTYLDEHREYLDESGIDRIQINNSLKKARKKTKGLVNSVNDLYDRVFLINGIYGHAIKVITMGDETYFKGVYKDIAKNVKSRQSTFNAKQQKALDVMQKKYPEISFGLTTDGLSFEVGDGKVVMNQDSLANVNYSLRSVNILSSDKAKQMFAKGKKNGWDLDYILTKLQVPKEQKQLILDKGFKVLTPNDARLFKDGKWEDGINLREDIITSLLAENSFVVEVNTAKEPLEAYDMVDETGNGDFAPQEFVPDTELITEEDEEGNVIGVQERVSKKGEQQIKDRENKRKSTQHNSDLTAPGGTNYTENEISTPGITPSIKGHGKFSTDNGIGWFRSDDRAKFITEEERSYMAYDDPNFTKTEGEATKTRRILEIQSDLFQKGRDKEKLVASTININNKLNKINNLNLSQETLDKITSEGRVAAQVNDILNPNLKFEGKKIESLSYYNGSFRVFIGFEWGEYKDNGIKKITKKEYLDLVKKEKEYLENSLTNYNKKIQGNNFLQLLNKKDAWVNFFIQSIVQDSAKKGYEKVLFPTGNTLGKIQGFTKILNLIKKSEQNIADIKKEISDGGDIEVLSDELLEEEKSLNNLLEANKNALSTISFYDTKVFSNLKKYAFKKITDEHNNTWIEVDLSQEKVKQEILLQTDEKGAIRGQANIDAMSVLVDPNIMADDTIYHEYAHHYIAWNRNSPLVMEAIKKWGTEEKLVQAIGEQSLEQDGEVKNWLTKFIKWLKGDVSKISKLDAKKLRNILTDAFLTNYVFENELIGSNNSENIPSRVKKTEPVFDINKYYSQVDSGIRDGLEENESMLVNQFKRAQSELSRGSIYTQTRTIVGLKRRKAKDNLLQHLIIRDDLAKAEGDIYEFDSLTNKTFDELEGLGVIRRFIDGSLVHSVPNGIAVRFNIGNEVMVLGVSREAVDNAILSGVDPLIVEGVARLLNTVGKNSSKDTFDDISSDRDFKSTSYGVDTKITSRSNALTLTNIKAEYSRIKSEKLIAMPDYTPSITLTDPVSYINLLNSMNLEQENSDAIQFIHPLLSAIMSHARGNSLGVFNTEKYEAVKTVTTTFEYDKFRQVLQKKSVQMPFSEEQMKKLGSMELYNTLKLLNTSIPFTKRRMSFLSPLASGRTITEEFNNLQELYEYVTDHESYKIGSEKAWDLILDILRQNPENLYNFVGTLTVPSNQKTGHKKFNKFSDVFTNKPNKDLDVNIDYMANEFNFEILSKAHEYDVSGKLHEASSLTLLSQLVNAVSFGGLSNLTSKNLQNAMMSKMMLNRVRIGKDLAQIARDLHPTEEWTKKLVARLEKGDVSTEGYSPEEQALYREVMRLGVHEMARLAFQKSDSALMGKLIKGTDIIVNEDGLEIEGDEIVYSLDSPQIRAKVLGTLRSSFFKDTVKMKMSGFIGTVSAAHKVITMFTAPGQLRTGRQGYIKAVFLNNFKAKPSTDETTYIELLSVVGAEKIINEYLMPQDLVEIRTKGVKTSQPVLRPLYSVDLKALAADPNKEVLVVVTPDLKEEPLLDINKFNALDSNALINIDGKTIYKWYLQELYNTTESINALFDKYVLEENIVEKYNLRWMDVVKVSSPDDGIKTIKDTEAFKNYYRLSFSSKTTEKQLEGARAEMILETQSKDQDGDSMWKVVQAEVVLPTYIKSQFNIPSGTSLSEIIGTDSGNQRINATKWFAARHKRRTKIYNKHVDTTKRIYANISAKKGVEYAEDMLTYLESFNDDDLLNPEAIKVIKAKMEKIELEEIDFKASNFLKTLETALTRIPGQSKQSGFIGNVVEFLDAQGNATFAATEHLVNTGGDLDIDTLSVLTKTVGKSGAIEDHTIFIKDDGGFNNDDMLVSYEKEVKDVKNRVKKGVAQLNVEASKYIEKRAYKKKTNTSSERAERLEEQYQRAVKIFIDPAKEKELVEAAVKRVHEKYENIISNAIADGVFRALDNPSTAVELNTPISMGMFFPIMDRLAKLDTTTKTRYSGENYTAIFQYENLAAQGKEAIGIYATVLKINSAIQAAKINFDYNYKNKLGRQQSNPFNFVHSITYTNTEGEQTLKPRNGFADLDRFPIMQSIEKYGPLQNALKNIIGRTSTFDSTTVNTLVALLEDSVVKSLQIESNRHKALDLLQKQALGEITGQNIDNEAIKDFRDRIDNHAFVMEESEAAELFELFNEDINSSQGRGKIISVLNDTIVDLNEISFTDRQNAVNTVLTLFDIELPVEVAESDNIIAAFTSFLKKEGNEKLISKAFINVMGKQLSNDVQSQFLSAATDNAKALILGKIKSNSLTNPVITTMLLLGYDTDVIIDFLYDPKIVKVFDYFLKQKSKLQRTRVTSREIKLSKLDMSSDSVRSLIDILDISERVTKFRALRSLNENAQIEQYKLDKILFDVASVDKKGKIPGSHILYKAIIDDDISVLSKLKGAEGLIFDTASLIFLHPQSRSLFMSIYESENFKLPAVSNVVGELRKMIDSKSGGMEAYKNINSYISKMQVVMFLNRRDEDGKVYKFGNVVKLHEDGSYTTSKVPLNNPDKRAEFVENFGDYLNKTLKDIAQIKVDNPKFLLGDNAALSSLGYMKIFGASKPVFGFPKLKNDSVDNIDVALIFEGIKELQIGTDIEELDIKHSELYRNLSLYALIVSAGEIKKGTMIEVYEDLNLELSKFVKSMTIEDYEKFRVTDELTIRILQNRVPTEEELKKEKELNDAKLGYGEEDQLDPAEFYSGEEDTQVSEEDIETGENEEEFDIPVSYNYSYKRVVYSPLVLDKQFKGTMSNIGQVFKSVDPYLKGSLFYAPKYNEIAYRLFPSNAAETLPNTFNQAAFTKEGIKIPDSIANTLTLIGLQVGFSSIYNGQEIRIMGFAGNKRPENASSYADYYIVLTRDGLKEIAGAHLMKYNDDLLLQGNIIEEVSSTNIGNLDNLKDIYLDTIQEISDIPINVGKVIDKDIKSLYNNEDIINDSILSQEFEMAGIKDILKIDDKNLLKNTLSYSKYYSQDVFPTASFGSKEIMIPSFNSAVDGGKLLKGSIMKELMFKAMNRLNDLDKGESITFYGIKANTEFRKKSKETLVGGIDTLLQLFKVKALKASKPVRGVINFGNGAYSALVEQDTDYGAYRVIITKNDSNTKMLVADNSVSVFKVKTNDEKVSTTDKIGISGNLKALELNIINTAAFKSIEVAKLKGTLIVVEAKNNTNLVYFKQGSNSTNEIYKELVNTKGPLGLSKTTFNVNNDTYEELMSIIEKDKSEFINKSC